MSLSRAIYNFIFVIIILLFFPIIIGGLLNHPLGMSYVETGSMAPQLDPGDGFILVPPQLSGGYDVGDVVTFRAQNFPYEYVTHRIVGITDKGFVTQGDSNPFTDQGGSLNEPYVKEEQIVGKALEFRGNVLNIPRFGSIVNFVSDTITKLSNIFYTSIGINMGQRTENILFSIGVLIVIAALSESFSGTVKGGRERVRKVRKDASSTYVLFTFITIFLIFASMTSIMSLEHDNLVDFVATEGSTTSRAIHIGETVQMDLMVENNGILPIYVFIDGIDGKLEVEPVSYRIGRGDSVSIQYLVNAPEETGYYREYLPVDVYLGILPYSVTETLRSAHRYLPIIFVDILAIGISITVMSLTKKEFSVKKRTITRARAKNVL